MGRASYGYQYAKDEGLGGELSNSPRHMAKVNVSVPLLSGKAFAGIELQFFGNRRTLSNSSSGNILLTNLMLLERVWWERVEVSATARNVFGRKYGTPGSEEHVQDLLPQEGRALLAKVTYRL